jgi:hypothetical protein
MSPRVPNIMLALDKIRETAEQQRDDARGAWLEAVKLVLATKLPDHNTQLMMAQLDDLRRVYILAQSRLEGMSFMWTAASEIYNLTNGNGEGTRPPGIQEEKS